MDADRLRRWTRTLSPGESRSFLTAEWADALVVVEHGELEIECGSGRCARFPSGSVLTFAGLPIRYLHNRSTTPVVLSAVTRTTTEQETP